MPEGDRTWGRRQVHPSRGGRRRLELDQIGVAAFDSLPVLLIGVEMSDERDENLKDPVRCVPPRARLSLLS